MSAFTNKQINEVLTSLRDDLRDGRVNLPIRLNRNALKEEISKRLGVEGEALVCGPAVNPQTRGRFAILFAQMPQEVTQDDVAKALQNFMNRRKEPWLFVARRQAAVELAFMDDIGSGA